MTTFFGAIDVRGDLEKDGTIIWDTSNGYIPQGRLQNDTVTVAGNNVALGDSVTVNHSDLSSVTASQHHPQIDVQDSSTTATDGPSFMNLQSNLSASSSGSGVNINATDTRTDVSDGGSLVVSNVTDINFGTDIDVSDDSDGSVTVSADTTGISTDVSDNNTTVVSNTGDINFSSGLDVTDDTDGTVTIDADISSTEIQTDAVGTSEIATDAVTTTEANFTDQQLGTGDSVEFNELGLGVSSPNRTLQVGNIDGSYGLFTASEDISNKGGILLTNNLSSGSGENSFKITSRFNNSTSAVMSIGIVDNSDVETFLNTHINFEYNGNSDFNNNNILNAGKVQFSDRDGDGDQWEIKEDSNGDLVATHPTGGTTVIASE